MIVRDLGELHGDLLIYGGVYSNLHALRAFMDIAQGAKIPACNIICTGDIVAYCADPEACAQRVRAIGGPVLAGNCERNLANGDDDCGCGFDEDSACNLLSRAWYAHADAQTSVESKKWMATLPDRIVFSHHGKRYAVLHGAASDISRFIWPTTPDTVIAAEIEILTQQVGAVDIVLAGHTGLLMTRKIGSTIWHNSGAIGMPAHNGKPSTHYSVISQKGIINNTLSYDHHAAHRAMRGVGLTQGYDKTLLSGVWPSEDNLPVDMRVSNPDCEQKTAP
ncbi:metallophosphoesterase family protein [Paramylibacter ulvae]|nr:metallophosphoesterase family protein [Amylibacter ulvae]